MARRRPPKFIQKAIKRPGALTRKANRAGMTVLAFSRRVKANPGKFTRLTRRQAAFFLNVLRKVRR